MLRWRQASNWRNFPLLTVLSHPVFARLFAAQVVALLGTGLMTVALGLLAYDMAGAAAGQVLGTALAIKMVAYVVVSPVAQALAVHWPRRAVLIGADLVRLSVALVLPFVTQVWQVYALVLVLQSASATFTPAFQALIPDVLRDEAGYTRALSLSRLAYDLENLLSPALAGLLLSVVSFHWLFSGTAVGFAVSVAVIAATALPARRAEQQRPFRERLVRGGRIYLATPRLRGLLALNFGAAAAGAFVLVNTVVIVRAGYGFDARALAVAMAAFGAGSMCAALALPRMLGTWRDRPVMLAAGLGLGAVSLAHAAVMAQGLLPWPGFLAVWALSGFAQAAILTPSGRLLRRSAHAGDRPAVFAAQFALSHACWLVTYPLAGWAGQAIGLGATQAVLALLALSGVALALWIWPAGGRADLVHRHDDLAPDHPHLKAHGLSHGQHRHAFVIDDEHRVWPSQG